jgi:hypothetical protein
MKSYSRSWRKVKQYGLPYGMPGYINLSNNRMRIIILALVELVMAIGISTGVSSPALAQSSLLPVEYKVSATQLDFGAIGLGTSVTMELHVTNLSSTDSIEVTGILLDGNAGFSLQQGNTRSIHPGDSAPLFIRFFPTRVGTANDRLVVVVRSQTPPNSVDTVGVSLTGSGELVGVRLDTVAANAGDLVTLHILGLINPFRDTTITGGTLVSLHYNPRALFPKEARIVSTGESLQFDRVIDSSLILFLPGKLTQETVVAITFRGLSTGQPANIVRLDSVKVEGEPLPIAGNGLVLLSGCDIEHELKMGRRVSALAVRHDPASPLLTLTYRAPAGSAPELRLYDINGDCCLTRILAAATDEEQTTQVPVPTLGHGFYLLELRDRAERAILPLMIAR